MIDKEGLPVTFESPCAPRIRFVQAKLEDAERTLAAINPATAGNLSFFREKVTLERQQAWLKKMITSPGDAVYFFEDKETGRLIGAAGLHELDFDNDNARIGLFVFHPDDRGKGYSREAMALLQELAFGPVELHKLYVRVLARNAEGCAKYLRLGFKQEGLLREEYRLDGVYCDMIVFSILFVEWIEKNTSE